jgi:hypothetical protein
MDDIHRVNNLTVRLTALGCQVSQPIRDKVATAMSEVALLGQEITTKYGKVRVENERLNATIRVLNKTIVDQGVLIGQLKARACRPLTRLRVLLID